MTDDERRDLERVAEIAGAVLPPEPVPGVIRTDAELDRVQERIERGEQAEQELAYRALMNDHDPTLYAEIPMLDDDRHVLVTPKAKLESQRDSYVAALKAAKAANDRDLVAVQWAIRQQNPLALQQIPVEFRDEARAEIDRLTAESRAIRAAREAERGWARESVSARAVEAAPGVEQAGAAPGP